MEQQIMDFYQDEEGVWVAKLACRHRQHVRHNPPFVNRPWVLTAAGRKRFIGDTLFCKKCTTGAPEDF
jgi:hypothetical protein